MQEGFKQGPLGLLWGLPAPYAPARPRALLPRRPSGLPEARVRPAAALGGARSGQLRAKNGGSDGGSKDRRRRGEAAAGRPGSAEMLQHARARRPAWGRRARGERAGPTPSPSLPASSPPPLVSSLPSPLPLLPPPSSHPQPLSLPLCPLALRPCLHLPYSLPCLPSGSLPPFLFFPIHFPLPLPPLPPSTPHPAPPRSWGSWPRGFFLP